MNKYILLLIFIAISGVDNAQCLVSSLIINTGYDPVSGLAIPGGANGSPAVTDPYWKLTSVSPGIAAAIPATPIPGLVEVIPGNNADVITYTYPWTNNPFGNPGGWISCLNSNTYNTDGTGPTGTSYYMILGRPFRMCSNDSITFSFYMANDNYIGSTNVDGTPLSFSQPVDTPLSNFEMFTYFTQTLYLTAGTHTVNIEINNYNSVGVRVNPTGLNLYGTISSATGTNSLVSESNPGCSSYVCGATTSIACDSISLPDTLHTCVETPVTLPATLYGGDSIVSIAWTPTTGLSDPAILNPSITTSVSGWYYLTINSIIDSNLVINGNFSAGNVSFLSPDYTYLPAIPYSNEYTISTDVFLADPGIGIHFYDHTNPPTGNMMLLNGGSPAANTIAWQETINVNAGSEYFFGAWYAYWTYDVTGVSNPSLLVEITPVGGSGSPSINNFAALSGAYSWNNEAYVWTAPAGATSAIIQIIDQNAAYYYNDFCLDDISFQQICTAKDSVYVDVTTSGATYGRHDTSICALVSAIVLNAPAGYASYAWSNGSTASSIIADTGIYWVDASISCATVIDTFHVTAIQADISTLAKDTSACTGNIITLNAPGGYNAYLWNTGAVTSSVTAGGGAYWVSASIGCTLFIDTFHVSSIPLPIVALGNDTTICSGDFITLSSLQPEGSQYLWSNGSTGASIKVAAGATYTLTVTENGCSASSSVKVSEISKPAAINLGPDTTLCSGDELILSADNNSGSIVWSTGGKGSTITVTTPGNYWVSSSNICGSTGDTVNVDFEMCDIWFPSAFTPNGDGLNDIIRVVGTLKYYNDFSLSIYNRFGQRVFYTEDIYDGWNGKFNGVNQDLGTYFYMIFYTLEGKKHMMKGDLELIR